MLCSLCWLLMINLMYIAWSLCLFLLIHLMCISWLLIRLT
nr:MAG TPA: hypothetical protein [Caudoviricetes sp.]